VLVRRWKAEHITSFEDRLADAGRQPGLQVGDGRAGAARSGQNGPHQPNNVQKGGSVVPEATSSCRGQRRPSQDNGQQVVECPASG
jgi:hypothetical protein